jgi:YHS domain-containing protein
MPEQNPKEEVTTVDPVGGGTVDKTYVYEEVTTVDPVGGGTVDKTYVYEEVSVS